MKLISCYIENFGKLHEFSYDFEDGLNIIVQENGWGKSTFAAFIKAMFYGMDYTTKKSLKENERKRYTPWQGGNYGGYIIFEVKNKKYRIERFFGVRDKDDIYHLYDENTGMISSDFGLKPGEDLFGIDVFAYERSTYIPQDSKEMLVNDSLTAKLSSAGEGCGEVENYQSAMELLEDKIKYYKKTGDRGYLADLESQINQISLSLERFANKTESVESLKEKKAELESRRVSLFNELKELRDEMKKTSEYDAVKAKKSHYDMLVKNHLEAKSKADSDRLFFEKMDLIAEIELKKDEYDEYEALEDKYKDESENLKELEYRKHALTTQYESNKKTPLASFLMIIGGFVAIGCALCLWVMGNLNIVVPVTCAVVGLILVLIGFVTWIFGNNKLKKEFDEKIDSIDELIEVSKMTSRDITLKKEQKKKSVENYIKAFQVEQPGNYMKSLIEIENKIEEYQKSSIKNENIAKELAEFEANNEMEKIRGLTIPKYSLGELQKRENGINNELMSVMEEKNSIARRMDSMLNADDDENDLMQMKENLSLKLKEATNKYELLLMTKEYLKTANEQYKSKYIYKMQEAFKDYVNLLNGVQNNNTSIDIDLKVSVEEYGMKRDIDNYSVGSRDLLSLCTRFALVKAMFADEQPFIILDDPFVNLDGSKIDNAMKFLEELAGNYQLLYFTCHESRV